MTVSSKDTKTKYSGIMRAYARIIAEQQSADHWTAWFADLPQMSASGEWPSEAVMKLLELFGSNEFETDETSSIDDATTEQHIEMRIPFKRLRRIPVASVN